ncbi:hypothetical protein H310_03761 [Aphanomyces invadans]|uniref:Uncharacterized protein n=1 Tax=Aphanomyces invadans TaxID=157072 RepID=A0A024UKN0_9STRA|nr:hypothetical protein H310_03761 [Aphanomyces invadans]ETW06188.1 hypothetical protein H310_03761 [Aphanomyces invadans]|eukprot:XP_008865965.1 hypothetical protein H310_03761 [Aphanomyces invadans]
MGCMPAALAASSIEACHIDDKAWKVSATSDRTTMRRERSCSDAVLEVLAPYFDDRSSISTDRSSCLSWEDESEDDSCVDEGDDVEIHCEQDHYPLHRRQSDVAMFRASVLQAHACPLHLHQIFDSLQELHHRVYVDRCLVHVRPSFLLLDLVHAATSVELMKRTLLDVPLEVLDLLLDMIDDTWVDILGLQHYGKRGEVHYARL